MSESENNTSLKNTGNDELVKTKPIIKLNIKSNKEPTPDLQNSLVSDDPEVRKKEEQIEISNRENLSIQEVQQAQQNNSPNLSDGDSSLDSKEIKEIEQELTRAEEGSLVFSLSNKPTLDAWFDEKAKELGLEKLTQLIKESPDVPEAAAYSASNNLTQQIALQRASLANIKASAEELEKKLKRSVNGIGDASTRIDSLFKNSNELTVNSSESLVSLNAIIGSMRRIVLWNSGISIILRSLPMDLLNSYFENAYHTSYEYGKEHGWFYYYFDDIEINKQIIEVLLPYAISGSNYEDWRDTDKLMSVISWQDYPTILWAMGAMMYPLGKKIRFVCTEEGCGKVHDEQVDLSKLHLLNNDLISPEMCDHFKKPTITDADLENYKKLCYKDNVRNLTFTKGDYEFNYELTFRSASIADQLRIGLDFEAELRKNADPTSSSEVLEYKAYNRYKCFDSWVDRIVLTITDKLNPDNVPKIIKINNTNDEYNKNAIRMLMEDLQLNYPKFPNIIQKFIMDSTISHIAFYIKECPHCHKEPKNSYHGYIPYDPMRVFFHLVTMKIIRGQAAVAASTISENIENS